MTTGTDIVKSALWYSGITGMGIEPAAEDTSAAQTILNDMLSEWSTRRWLIYHLLDYSIVCDGRTFYTIGKGGDIDVDTRPERIEAAYIRLLHPADPGLRNDYQLEQILSREDYSRITLKEMQSFPSWYFYDPAYPLGNIYPWPIPNNQYELHVLTRVILPRITVLANDLLLPPGYDGAIKWNLARRLRAAYRYPADAEVNAMAANGINVISSNNFAVPTLQMPSALRGGVRYNFYSDTMDS